MKKPAAFAFLDRLPSLWLPITLIVVYILVAYLTRDILPSSEEIATNFARLFARYGYEIVLVGAFLEGALIIDMFVPGGSIVLVGAYFSSIGVISYPIFLLSSVTGFAAGFFLDFLVGYYGWSDVLDRVGLGKQLSLAREKVKKHEGKAFILGYIHPDSSTIVAAAAGAIKMDIGRFALYNVLATFIWVSVWTGLVYLFGPVIQKAFEGKIAYIAVILLVIAAILGWFGLKKVQDKEKK